MLQLTEESYLLVGTGTPPQMQGFHTKSGIGSLARGASEDNTDVVLRAITNVNSTTGFANATGIVMHPLNMQTILLLRTTTGEYIWGHPSEKGPRTLWGLPVVETPAETQGKALVGDFRMYSHISRKLGMRIDVGYINEDFKNNILRLRAEMRESLEIYRAAAFCETTSLN
jgi:HK97 family phage major capsid protein